MRIEGENVTAVAFGDGIEERARAFGLFGGGAGSVNASAFRFPDGSEKTARSKEIVRGIPPGTMFRQRAGGGGGYGPPRERPAGTVAEEVRDGLISPEAAREVYRVAVDPETLEIDREATAALREP